MGIRIFIKPLQSDVPKPLLIARLANESSMEELKNVVRARLSLPPNLRIDQVLLSDVGAVVDHPD